MSENLITRLIPHQGCVITRTGEGIEIEGKGFLTTGDWHEIVWEIGLERMRVIVDGEVRFEGAGDYSGIESAPSVGPCFGSTVSIRELTLAPLA